MFNLRIFSVAGFLLGSLILLPAVAQSEEQISFDDLAALKAPPDQGIVVILRPVDPMLCVPAVSYAGKKIYESKNKSILVLLAEQSRKTDLYIPENYINRTQNIPVKISFENGKTKFYFHVVEAPITGFSMYSNLSCTSSFKEVGTAEFKKKMKSGSMLFSAFNIVENNDRTLAFLPFDPRNIGTMPLAATLAASPSPVLLPVATDRSRPTMSISAPRVTDGKAVTRESSSWVTGTVADDSGVALVTVNGEPAALDEKGNFSAEVLLKLGTNDIVVTAVDIHRNQATEQFKITRETAVAAVTDRSPPLLAIRTPSIHPNLPTIVSDTAVRVTGKVQDKSGVAVVTVNGQPAALDAAGDFSAEVLLRVGPNDIVVSALDIHRNEVKEQFTVTRESVQVAARPADTAPPVIAIHSPALTRGVTLVAREAKTLVKGTARDESGVAIVTVNGQEAVLDAAGNFSAEILLGMGENTIVVAATDIHRNQATEHFALRREATVAAPTAEPLPPTGRNIALVIGINRYQALQPLRTAVHDAENVATVLRDDYGFETRLLLDEQATRSGIVKELNALRRTLTSDDRLLIYYAGHGDYDRETDTAYWLPVDADRDETTNWIASKTISDELKRITARHVLVVADSCFSGTLTRKASTELFSNETREKFLRKQQEKPSRVLIASGGNEPVLDAGADGHSIFASAFIRALRRPERSVFTAEELLTNHVKESVAGRAEQTPEYKVIRNSGHDGGDFIFFKR